MPLVVEVPHQVAIRNGHILAHFVLLVEPEKVLPLLLLAARFGRQHIVQPMLTEVNLLGRDIPDVQSWLRVKERHFDPAMVYRQVIASNRILLRSVVNIDIELAI